MRRGNAVAVALLALVLAAALAAMALPRFANPDANPENYVVLIHDGAGETHELALSTDAELMVETALGTNTITVKDGAATVSDADCPGLDCTRQQAISAPGQQLICLPHRLWVEVVPRGTENGEMDVNAVESEEGDAADLVAR